MILRIVFIVVAVIAAILILAATKPNALQISRAVTINAPADKIFPLIADFHNWRTWTA